MNALLNEKQSRFLATLEVVRRELVVFDYSSARLFVKNINVKWVDNLQNDMEAAEILEAFGGRFSRLQDTIGDKLIPRALTMLAEKTGSVLDNLNRAERLGWIDNVENWLVARELRNRLVHEYMTNNEGFTEDLLNAKRYIGMFQFVYDQLLKLAEAHCCVSENDLVNYLRAGDG